MILDELRQVYEQNWEKPALYLRNLLKEALQYYILNFIFNSDYAGKVLFKGGTCLRFCFDLPRLSEDIDLDIEDISKFDIQKFIAEIQEYFVQKLKFEALNIKVAGNQKIIYLKFPVLSSIGVPVNPQKPTEDVLFIRIDFSAISGKFYTPEVSLCSNANFSFLIRRYALSDLFAGKVAAVLTREKMEGLKRESRFKGRDYFDIWWFKEKGVKWNARYLASLTGITSETTIRKTVNEKIREAGKRKNELRKDLLPFFADPHFVKQFVENLDKLSF